MATELERTFPIALARLVHNSDGISDWVVDHCPLCGKRHSHGAGRAGIDNPYALLGGRVAECAIRPLPEPGVYILVAAPAHEAP